MHLAGRPGINSYVFDFLHKEITGELVEALRKTGENEITDVDKTCVQIAGLCHDLGRKNFL